MSAEVNKKWSTCAECQQIYLLLRRLTENCKDCLQDVSRAYSRDSDSPPCISSRGGQPVNPWHPKLVITVPTNKRHPKLIILKLYRLLNEFFLCSFCTDHCFSSVLRRYLYYTGASIKWDRITRRRRVSRLSMIWSIAKTVADAQIWCDERRVIPWNERLAFHGPDKRTHKGTQRHTMV